MQDVLIALCGLTPQVVTETLWALHHRTPPIHPTEIWILTTQEGAKACRAKLLGTNGALARFVHEYRPDPTPCCPASHVLILKGSDGKSLDDVRSEQDNRVVADQLADFICKQAERPDVRLHCSVAGGRKTMGVLLAGALQLFGRSEDQLYHVLVSPEFESLTGFFFPPQDTDLGHHENRATAADDHGSDRVGGVALRAAARVDGTDAVDHRIVIRRIGGARQPTASPVA